jgi:hypothetical protein
MLSPSVGKEKRQTEAKKRFGVTVEYGWMAGMANEAFLAVKRLSC